MDTPAVYRRLFARRHAAEEQWRLLVAAHVAGQFRLALHCDSHCRMLALAWRQRDAGEVAGQLLRHARVPLGHALQQLPAGNVGRATVTPSAPCSRHPR